MSLLVNNLSFYLYAMVKDRGVNIPRIVLSESDFSFQAECLSAVPVSECNLHNTAICRTVYSGGTNHAICNTNCPTGSK
ncbi:hypothetical protein ACKXLW_005609, partial [Escherichia coli]